MDNFDNSEYETGKEVRQKAQSVLKYVIIGIVLIALEILITRWWTLLLGPITIVVIFLIVRYNSAIRGFFGMKNE